MSFDARPDQDRIRLVVGSASCPTASPLVESYVYDGSDNRTSSRRVAGLTTTTLNQNVVDFLTPPGRTVDYVNATATGGTRTSDTDTTAGVLANARTYSYDGMGRLSAMTLFRPAGSSQATHAFTISIVYDHRSRPLYVSAMNNTTAVESRYQYDCDLEDRLLGSITTPNAAVTSTYTTETYAHVSALLVGTLRTNYVSSVGTESYMYTANEENGLPIASYAFTRTGTITTTEVWRSASYPYGEHITPPGTVGPPPWRFAGQLVLPLSDARVWVSGVNTLLRPALHLNRWRVYDPWLGRYLQPEPLALLGREQSTNAFGYASGDPVNRIDPTGRDDFLIGYDGDLVFGYFGVTQSGGIVYDSDEGYLFDPDAWSAFWGDSTDPGSVVGLNLGASACVGYFPTEVEGAATGWDSNVGIASPTFYFNEDEFQGVTVGVGPGVGISVSTGETTSWTFWEIWQSIWS